MNPTTMNQFRILFKVAVYDPNTVKRIVECYTDIGLINSLDNSYSITTSSAGIPSQPAQNTFVMDLGVTRAYSFSYLRIQTDTINDTLGHFDNGTWIPADSTKWSNGFWAYVMKRYIVNRWQTQTDGCRIVYPNSNNDPEGELYPEIPPTNVFVSSFTIEETQGETTTLTGKITFAVGSSTDISEATNRKAIVYDANFGPQAQTSVDEAQADQSNYVRAYDNLNEVEVLTLPDEWYSRASNVYGIYDGTHTPTQYNTWFRWSTSPTELLPRREISSVGALEPDTVRYGYANGDSITLSQKITDLYAHYLSQDTDEPMSG